MVGVLEMRMKEFVGFTLLSQPAKWWTVEELLQEALPRYKTATRAKVLAHATSLVSDGVVAQTGSGDHLRFKYLTPQER